MKIYEITLYNRYGEVYWTQQVTANSPEEAGLFAQNHEQFGDGDEILQVNELRGQHLVGTAVQKVIRMKKDAPN